VRVRHLGGVTCGGTGGGGSLNCLNDSRTDHNTGSNGADLSDLFRSGDTEAHSEGESHASLTFGMGL